MKCIHLILHTLSSFVACSFFTCMIASCGSQSRSYQECCEKGDYEAAHAILAELHDAYVQQLGANTRDEQEELENARSTYFTALEKIYNSEGAMLIAKNEQAASNRVIFMLKEIPFDGTRPSPGLHEGLFYSFSDDEVRRASFFSYKQSVEIYNKLCSKFLDLAIIQKNKSLAQNILLIFENDVLINQGGDRAYDEKVFVGMDDGYVQYSTESRDVAAEKFNNALIQGVFDN